MIAPAFTLTLARVPLGSAVAASSAARCGPSPPRRPRTRLARAAGAGVAAAALAGALALGAPASAAAADSAGETSEAGAAVFEARCAACHAGGGNVIGFARRKTLKLAALEKYGYNDKDAIVALLRQGKSVMPKYGLDKLSDEEAGDVAEFVLSAAQRGWK